MSTDTSITPFAIRCPKCQKKLKIEDRRLLGKKVKCPGCKEPFVVEVPKVQRPKPTESPKPVSADPPQKNVAPPAPPKPPVEEEVQLELVTDEPPVGTSAKWVPDTPVVPSAPSSPVSPSPPASPAGNVSPAPQSDSVLPNFSEAPSNPTAPVIAPVEPVASGGSSELNRLRARRKKGWGPTVLVGGFLLLGVGTVAFLVMNYEPKKASSNSGQNLAQEEDLNTPVAENEPYSRARLENRPKLVSGFKPTEGQPLSLQMMPRGVNFLIHIRPALLWSDEYQYQELKASLTDDVTNWIAATLKEVCRREPAQIEEAYIGFLLGASGSEPEICTVVTLKEPAKMSDLIEEFSGESVYSLEERPDLRLKQDDKYAYLILDNKTIAIAPRLYAAELEESQKQPFILSVPMENLLRDTDDQRLFTAMGVLRDLQLHYPAMMPEASHQAVGEIVEWFGEDVEAVSWSVHTDPYFHSELKVHPVSTSNPHTVNQRLTAQLKELPDKLMNDVCLKMSPREMRFRNFIGRLPAMSEALRQSTISSTTSNLVSLTTVLPGKAAPNLALATLFTVNEAARTDFTAEIIVAQNNQPKLPDSVVERLQLPVDAEFNRTPLEQALTYLAGEVEVKMAVDGDALKDAGYTKNMPQTFKLGIVPLEKALKKIIDNYQEQGKVMVMSIDEKTKTIHILTEKFAKNKNMPIYEFK